MAPTIQTVGSGSLSEKRTPTTHSTPVPPRTAERRSELVCRVKYNNTLPDIPFDCKFIAYPFESTRFIEYKSTSLERNYKYEVLTEHDLGVTIDLINKDTYAPNYNIQLDPADEKLLEEDITTPQDSKRSRHHARSVSWLRRTEYISTEQTRFQPQVMDKVEAKVGFSIKKNFKDDTLYMDRESQVKAIERTFADAKLPIEKHYSKPNVTPVEIMPVYPDFKYWKYPCAQVIFDSDPAPQGRPVPAQIEEMSQAMIRGVMDESGEQFVAYFLPSSDTLDKRKLDILNNVEYTDEQEYEYKMAREYNWNVKSKSCKGYEENYFLIVRDEAVYYNELETRVRLSKRRQKVGAAPSNTRLVVTHRPLNATEFRIQRLREKFLEPPNEEDEEEEEEEEEEDEEEATVTQEEEPTTREEREATQEGERGEKRSGSRSVSPAARSNKSKSGSPAAKSSRSRSGSPAARSSRSRSGSPAARSSRSRSESPAARSSRSRSGSPAARSSRSRSGSPAARSSRSRSGSPAARSSRSRSGSPAARSSRSKSGSPAARSSRSRSRSPAARSSRSRSGSPAARSSRSRSGSPAARSSRSRSGSPAARSSRSRSGSPAARSSRSRSGSPAARSSRSRSGSPAARSSRSRSGSPAARSSRSRSGSPAARSSRSRSGSSAARSSRSRSGSPTA